MRFPGLLAVLSAPLVATPFIAAAAADADGAVAAGPVLQAETNRPDSSTFPKGEGVTLTFRASGLAPGATTRLHVVIRDDREVDVASLAPELTADAVGRATFAFDPPRARLGYYEVTAQLADGTTIPEEGTRPAGQISYAIVPDPAERIDYGAGKSRFGMQGGFNRNANVIPLLGVRYYITGRHWVTFEAKGPGQFPVDRAAAQAKGKSWPPRFEDDIQPRWGGKPWSVYPLGQVVSSAVPDWARVPGTEGRVCRTFGALNEAGRARLAGYAADYARAFMADHPGPGPRLYQALWEPANGWCYNGSPEQLVEILRLTYAGVHKVDPHAIVAGPTLYAEPYSTAEISLLWKAGMGKYIDAFSIHAGGPGYPPETHGMPSVMLQQIAEGEKISGRHFGLLSTEHGAYTAQWGIRGKARADTRISLIQLGEGAQMDMAFYVADFFDPKEGHAGLQRHTQGFYWNLSDKVAFGSASLSPKMSVPAYAAMTRLIDGTTSRGRLPGLSDTQLGYRFVRGKTTIDAVWDYGAGSDWRVPTGAQVCDWMGNCGAATAPTVRLGEQPVYLVRGTP